MKTILITGASSGLGKATAKLFQSRGWRVIATMRQPEKEKDLNKLENVYLVKLDVGNVQEINQIVTELTNSFSIDVVLNNAGYGLVGPLEALNDEQIIKQIETNLLGVIRITKAFTPYFRIKRNGMFLNITSTFGLMGFPTCSIYSATKFAVDGFSESMAYELAQFGIQVKVIAPGGIQTDFASRSMDFAQHHAYEALTVEVSKGYSAAKVAEYSKAEDIALVVYQAATDEKNQLRYIAGKDAEALYEERTNDGAEKQFQQVRDMFNFN